MISSHTTWVQIASQCVKNMKSVREYDTERTVNTKKERETNVILSGLVYNSENRYWTIKYPCIDDPHKLPNNFRMSVIRLKGT